MLPILNAILSFFNQLIGESMLENICNWTNEFRSIDINIEELRCYLFTDRNLFNLNLINK